MSDYSKVSMMKSRLENEIYKFEETLHNMEEKGDGTDSINNYRRRIEDTIALQFLSGLIQHSAYSISIVLSSLIKKGGADVLKYKSSYSEIKECMEHYKSQNYIMTQRIVTLRELIKIKVARENE
jgi:hypothetical protein